MTRQEMIDSISASLNTDSNVLLLLREAVTNSLVTMSDEQLTRVVTILNIGE